MHPVNTDEPDDRLEVAAAVAQPRNLNSGFPAPSGASARSEPAQVSIPSLELPRHLDQTRGTAQEV